MPKNELTFINEFESIEGWESIKGISEKVAHSGRYSITASKDHAFSKTFRLKFKDISDKPVKRVYFSAWCLAETLPATGNIVLSVKSSAGDLIYNAVQVDSRISDKSWVQFRGMADLSINNANQPDNEVGFYIWNTGDHLIFADDVRLQFEY